MFTVLPHNQDAQKPWKTQPVVSTCGTYLHALSRWINHHLLKLMSFVPTYLCNYSQLLQQLKQVGAIPTNAKLFTADATSMHTNIDSAHTIEVITDMINLHQQNFLCIFQPLQSLMDYTLLKITNLSLKKKGSSNLLGQLWVPLWHESMLPYSMPPMKVNFYSKNTQAIVSY